MADSMVSNFECKWNKYFPNKAPIPYLFKYYFQNNWLRVHSLPNSKRYANHAVEIDLLLRRQNQVISDCLTSGIPIFIVSGNYFIGNSSTPSYDQASILQYDFITGSRINLHKLDPKYFDDGESNDSCFIPMFTETVWEPNLHNDLLIKIANDETRAFLISFEKKIIIAPYDGGLDLITEDLDLKNKIRQKYCEMLSKRHDQL
ncbi:hypothetical protein [Acinetobacter sp. ANC 4648]|uniref:DUF3885 domain-containing protein n=1 Tax=Acinetobacter sp. ANC 4648 TaxID=1977875 RepID=UPI000A34EDBA|nr:hypothetical protein [Acinetobacter sp. ANC 4648]OTG81716.1 hypothetical protein B9T27_10645 [Acinetobacter sp. ANC 4648]